MTGRPSKGASWHSRYGELAPCRWAAYLAPVLEYAVSVVELVKRVWDGRERRTIIDRITFDLSPGELVLLQGPSGSGKTTLLALVGAMLSPTSGEVLLDGEPTSRMRDAHRAEVRRKKVGFVFQDVQLFEGMSAQENVLLPCVP